MTNLINLDEFDYSLKNMSEAIDEVYSKAFFLEDGQIMVNPKFVNQLQALSGDFFTVWAESSWDLIYTLGSERVFEILELLSAYRFATWEFEEYNFFEGMPETLKIYRGGDGTKEEVLKGFSWSLDLQVAKEFAEKHVQGLVLTAEIFKKDVLLINTAQHELVPHPKNLREIDVIWQHS